LINNHNPIGVFDSGVGGLSVLREIRGVLPNEHLLYVADSGAAPYGDRSSQFILSRARSITQFLIAAGVKSIVVACNTASAVAIQPLREQFPTVLIAIEPAVKPAIQCTRSRVIGVLATRQTLASASYSRLTSRYGKNTRILSLACPEFVDIVENGEINTPSARACVRHYIAPLLAQGADTLVLGCTHFPFLRAAIGAVAGPSVAIIDPAAAVARQLQRRLKGNQLLTLADSMGSEQFWTSGSAGKAKTVISRLWERDVDVSSLPARICVA
jgi:glutamate racemase